MNKHRLTKLEKAIGEAVRRRQAEQDAGLSELFTPREVDYRNFDNPPGAIPVRWVDMSERGNTHKQTQTDKT